MFMRLIPILAFLVMPFSHVTAESRNNLTNVIAAVDANVVFMRHALAPGYGDPDKFSLSDCNTQKTWTLRVESKPVILAQLSSILGFVSPTYSPVNGVVAKKQLNL